MSKSINATHYDRIPTFPSSEKKRELVVNTIVETPKGSDHKFRLMPEYGIIAYHHVLPEKLTWPYDYGFVPQTLAPDGDAVDILVITDDGLFPGCFVEARLIGALLQTEDGVENDRLIAVPVPSPGAPLRTDAYFDIADMPKRELEQIREFLERYSSEEGHTIEARGEAGAEGAMTLVKQFMKQYRKKAA